MKKYVTLLTLVLISGMARADFWSNCTTYGGTILQTNQYGTDANGNNLDKGGLCNDPNDTNLTNNCNGKKFCWGLPKQNWWSAFTWCESIGGKLATYENVCPGNAPGITGWGQCPNARIYRSDTAGWINMARGTDTALMVWFNAGDIDSQSRISLNSNRRALCEEK